MLRQNQFRHRVNAVMLLAYGDESLDEQAERVCSVAVVVGPEELWKEFELKWSERTNGVPFHANDCDSDRGAYKALGSSNKDDNHKANKALYRDLVALLADSTLAGFASVFDRIAQRKAFPQASLPVYYQPFLETLIAMRDLAASNDDYVELTFDNRAETEHNAALVYAYLRSDNPYWTERLSSKLSFESSRDNVRIQAADLFARESMKYVDNIIGPVKRPERKAWVRLQDSGSFAIQVSSTNEFERAKADLVKFLPDNKLTHAEFLKWLATQNRTFNLTAYLQFIGLSRSFQPVTAPSA